MWYDRTSSYHSSVAESPYICPRNSEPIWSGFRGLLCIGTSTVVGAPNFKKRNIENESNETFLFYSSAVRKTEGGDDWRQNLLLPDGREEHLQEVGTETL